MSGGGAKLVAVRLSIEDSETVRAALVRLGADGEAALKKLSFDTSSQAGPKLFQNAVQELEGHARELASTLGPMGSILSNVGAGYLVAGAAAGGFAELVKKSVEAAEEEEQAQRRVEAVLRATGNASGQTGASIEEMATRISRATLLTKDEVLNAAASLATFRNVGPDAFERTIQAAADMAAVFGGDLASNVQKLGLALDDPIKGMDRLRRSGLDLSPAQKEVIINLERTGDLAAAQAALLDALAQKMGGAAGAQHQGLTGAAHDVKQAWHDFLVELGETSHGGQIATGILDVLTSKLNGLHAKMQEFKTNPFGAMLPYGLGYAIPMAINGVPPKFNTPKSAPAAAAPDGAAAAAAQRQDEIGRAIDQSIKDTLDAAKVVGARQQFIDGKLKEVAGANELSIAALQAKFPDRFKSLAAAAGKEFDSEHAEENARKAADAFNKQLDAAQRYFDMVSKDVGDQIKLYADLAAIQATAFTQMRASQDALLVHQLEGHSGYFAAVKQEIADWLSDSLSALDAEEQKQLAELDQKAQGYAKDTVAFTQYQHDKAVIAQTYADKRAQVEAEGASRQFDLDRSKQGALAPDIAKQSQDMNQALKGVAADGLNQLENGLLSVTKGTEGVAQAFENMVGSILEDLAKLVLEKQVIGPLADLINGWIGGGATASANGNVFLGGNVLPFANGGIVDRPTMVPMALMGEAGPEAIIPLARGSNGKLGLAGGGAGDSHIHFAPNIVVNGGGDANEMVQALRAEMDQQKRDFFANSVRAYAEMKSRRIA